MDNKPKPKPTGLTAAFWRDHSRYADKWYRKNAKGQLIWVCWQDRATETWNSNLIHPWNSQL